MSSTRQRVGKQGNQKKQQIYVTETNTKGSNHIAIAASLVGVANAATECQEDCPSNTTRCCIYYSNGNVFIDSCCQPNKECLVKKVGGGVAVAPYEATMTYGASGCQ